MFGKYSQFRDWYKLQKSLILWLATKEMYKFDHQLCVSNNGRRYLVAKQDIPAGAKIFSESPLCFVSFRCSDSVSKIVAPAKSDSTSSSTRIHQNDMEIRCSVYCTNAKCSKQFRTIFGVRCHVCLYHYYCGLACYEDDKENHAFECHIGKKLVSKIKHSYRKMVGLPFTLPFTGED